MPIFTGSSSPYTTHQQLSMTLPPQVKACEQLLELRTADRHRLAPDVAREDEAVSSFETLAPQTQTVLLPINNLDPVTLRIAKNVQRRLEDIALQRLLYDQRQGGRLLAHVHRRHAHEHRNIRIRAHHGDCSSSSSTRGSRRSSLNRRSARRPFARCNCRCSGAAPGSGTMGTRANPGGAILATSGGSLGLLTGHRPVLRRFLFHWYASPGLNPCRRQYSTSDCFPAVASRNLSNHANACFSRSSLPITPPPFVVTRRHLYQATVPQGRVRKIERLLPRAAFLGDVAAHARKESAVGREAART